MIQTNKYGYSRTKVTYTFCNPSIQTNKYGYSRTTVCNHMVTAVIRTINVCMKYTFGCLGHDSLFDKNVVVESHYMQNCITRKS